MSADLLFGIHSVEAALRHDADNVIELFIESGAHNARLKTLSDQARELGIKPHARAREALDRMTGGGRHQGVVARYRAPAALDDKDLDRLVVDAGREALLLVLDGVTDPHNLGACLRSAAAARVTAVIVPKDRAVGITPIVRRASAGAADSVPLVVVTNLARSLRGLKEAGVWLNGLASHADRSIYALDLKGPSALVLGGEAEGMRRLVRESCDFVACIPMPGAMDSLNVSVAAGVVLFEALRQRGGAT
ncbi:MAG: 23S rRNA (guanosine(2251)-2'-O)-methyltransferase RlmB [Rhodanobacteraceae bacterium]